MEKPSDIKIKDADTQKDRLREERVQKAKKYLTLVRKKLFNDEYKYQEFLIAMKAYKDQK
jgi:hypothetical protein